MAESVNRVLLENWKSVRGMEKLINTEGTEKNIPLLHDLFIYLFSQIDRRGKPFKHQEIRNTFKTNNKTNRKQQKAYPRYMVVYKRSAAWTNPPVYMF